jgi:hypothetical protein
VGTKIGRPPRRQPRSREDPQRIRSIFAHPSVQRLLALSFSQQTSDQQSDFFGRAAGRLDVQANPGLAQSWTHSASNSPSFSRRTRLCRRQADSRGCVVLPGSKPGWFRLIYLNIY